ncbi:MAG: PepSY-associated TM helix domain-containing protein [Pseudomonadota bacterium]
MSNAAARYAMSKASELDADRSYAATAATQRRRPAPREKTQRRRLFELHSWLGFNLALFMSLVVFTGSLAVVSDELDWLFRPAMRAATPVTEPVDWGKLEASVRAFAPRDALTTLSAGEEPYFNYAATMLTPEGSRYYVYLDPVTAAVTGTAHGLTIQRFLRDLHRYLFMPSVLGLPLVTTMAVVLLISLYTGLKTVRNWKTVATRVRTHKGLRVLLGDAHKAAGLWGSWFFVIIIATSFWYFAEFSAAIGGKRFEPPRPGPTIEAMASRGPVVKDLSADAIIRAATSAFPELQPVQLQFPLRSTQAATVLGFVADPLVRKRANRVFVDPVSGDVIKVQRSKELGWVPYLNEIADPLHFGFFGGLVTKLLWFVFGLAMFALTVTGVILTWKRLRTRSLTQAQVATIPVLVLTTAFGVPYVQRYLDDGSLAQSRVLAVREPSDVLPVSLHLVAAEDSDQSLTGEVRLEIEAMGGRPLLEGATLLLGQDERINLRFGAQAGVIVAKGTAPLDQLLPGTRFAVALDLGGDEPAIVSLRPNHLEGAELASQQSS